MNLKILGSKPVNHYYQHQWVTEMDWVYEKNIRSFTPKTYPSNMLEMAHPSIPYIVKPKVTSHKFNWSEMMYAKDRAAACYLVSRLYKLDPNAASQGVVIREYVPLETFEYGISGTPFANEWRFFYYKRNLLTSGYYWSIAKIAEDMKEPPNEAKDLADKLAYYVSKHVNFFVLDIAKTKMGDWILIEINDGQMSGLSECNPEELYYNLKKSLNYE